MAGPQVNSLATWSCVVRTTSHGAGCCGPGAGRRTATGARTPGRPRPRPNPRAAPRSWPAHRHSRPGSSDARPPGPSRPSFAVLCGLGTLLLMLPIMRTGAGLGQPRRRTVHVGQRHVRDRSGCGGHRDLLEHPRAGGDPPADPDRRLRHPGSGHPVDPAAQPPARDSLTPGSPGRDRRRSPRATCDRCSRPSRSSRSPSSRPSRCSSGSGSAGTTTCRSAQAAWNGVFHSVSAFNNAGFALASDSLISFGQDPLDPGTDRRGHRARRSGLPGGPRTLPTVHRCPRPGAAPARTARDDPGRRASPAAASWPGARATGWGRSTRSASASPTRSRCHCTPA